METREFLNVHIKLRDPLNNIIVNSERRLGYRFMVAEWLWIWYGRDDFSIVQYNANMAKFSDDGKAFFGAYGPRVFNRWRSLVQLLKDDPDSRQAIIQIYRTPTGGVVTRDVPCTLTFQALVRDGRLNVIVNMRSSDVWLGLPYDFFTFSMLQNTLAAHLNVELGSLYFNLGSSHLYERDFEAAQRVLNVKTETLRSPRLPGEPPRELEEVFSTKASPALEGSRAYHFSNYVWNFYAYVLTSSNNASALEYLRNERLFSERINK